jgi:hypothetical protein
MLVPDKRGWQIANSAARQDDPKKHIQIFAAKAWPTGAEQGVETADGGNITAANRKIRTRAEHPSAERVKP